MKFNVSDKEIASRDENNGGEETVTMVEEETVTMVEEEETMVGAALK